MSPGKDAPRALPAGTQGLLGWFTVSPRVPLVGCAARLCPLLIGLRDLTHLVTIS